MEKTYQDLLDKYKLTNIIKSASSNIVAKVKHNKTTYIAKIMVDRSDPLIQQTLETEIQALKYFTKLKCPLFIKYVDHFQNIVIMEYIKGKLLIEYQHALKSRKWWISLLQQLIWGIYLLEEKRILHNDCWDANIILCRIDGDHILGEDEFPIVNAGFIIKIIDYQYMNQYVRDPVIRSDYVMTKLADYDAKKRRLGWSSKFHVGGDLNQILGILSKYEHIPLDIKNVLNKLVVKSGLKDFPYAITVDNKLTSGKYLMENWEELLGE